MENILHCLQSQSFNKDLFEIIIVEDRGGTYAGRALKNKFNNMNIVYSAPDNGWGKMGAMRNHGLELIHCPAFSN